MPEAEPLLRVDKLSIGFGDAPDTRRAVDELSFTVAPRETLALVGESGSGKSLTCLAVAGLLPMNARRLSGRIVWRGEDWTDRPEREWRRLRGKEMAFIFQDPAASLNPVLTVETQIAEAIRLHDRSAGGSVRSRVIELLEKVRIPDPDQRRKSYPHELSGGMQQRVMIAMALAGRPRLLLADEPTTALDVTIQAQILKLLMQLRDEEDVSILLVTHNLAIAASCAHRMAVLKDGRLVEEGPANIVAQRPSAPYTRQLVEAVPRLDGRRL